MRAAARRLAGDLDLRLVVLFGSAAREEPCREPEDYDFALLADRPLDTVEATNRFIRTLSTQEVDLVELRGADPLLMMMVARDGVVLYERSPGEFARFTSLAVRRHADTRKFRRAERDAIRREVAPPAPPSAPDRGGIA